MSYLPAKRLYLRGLGRDVSPEELSKFLSTYGKIHEVKFVHNYAFVEFELEADACLVYNIYRTTPLFGKEVTIQFARPLRKDIAALQTDLGLRPHALTRRSSSRGSVSRHPVVVMGIPEDMRWQELKDFGRSTGCLVAYCDLDPSNDSQGFIEYFTKEDAEYAIQTLDGATLGGQTVRVVNYDEVSGERRRKSPHSPTPTYGKQRITSGPPNPWGYGYGRNTHGNPGLPHTLKYDQWGDDALGVVSPLTYAPEPRGHAFVPQLGGSRIANAGIAGAYSVPDDDPLQYSPVSYRFFQDDFPLTSRYDYSNIRTAL